jgi:hypothetical protein
VSLPAFEKLDRSDLRRFCVACDCDLQKAAIRFVKSTALREIVFPVDTRACQIELQSGQFLQQGEDLEGNAIFYFRHMLCVGPWRKHGDAVIQAVLHRPSSVAALITANEETAATVVLSEKTIVPPV